jgi:hypothetical protein
MAKKAPAKPAAKRKPRAKKPVQPAIELSELSDETKKRLTEILEAKADSSKSIAWRSWLVSGAKAVALVVCGAVAGIWSAGGIAVGPGPVGDVLQQSYSADRVTQVAVLRDLATQAFDGTTDDGRKQAGEWFNAQRFRNRANDFGGYTDRVAEAIAANAEDSLANELEAK